MSMSEKIVIDTVPERCTGCRRCQLICSFHHLGVFSLSRAYIVIGDEGEDVNHIEFTVNCDWCGMCVKYCVYGALRFTERT